MVQILGLILLSFLVISVLLVPFINVLYRIKFQRKIQKTRDIFEERTPIFDKLHSHKIGTPVGGGVLIIFVVSVLYLAVVNSLPFVGVTQTAVYPIKREIQVLLFTFLSFAALGLYDDLRKTLGLRRAKFWGIRFRWKFLIQWILALIIASMLYYSLGIDIVNIRFFDVLNLGIFYIPFAAFTIVSFTNAVNISDGLDGLATGLLLICLIAFLVMSRSILDTTLSTFLGLLIGSLIAFLYFNVWPARIWLGDVGALSFGATLAVCGLLLGKPIALAVIGGMFVIEVASSLIQLVSKKTRGKKIFEVAPVHLWLQLKGWEEPKIVFRFWLAGTIFAILGLWLSFF
ncbi:phospho-N-acetylmuramoyl-pentapeptide-transferase [Candidatus Curtissbacteria bacterium RBG_13_40_7]|uniref:Phospho-N-acetylmuramoyl-pentapeptide-transferase n=1 Tax=Candidatus Curtissbacteria bacterium RBG_13_40_7 TaxID=1797706 RepID=A0A1F5FYD3_9BACT|nr:MAG: phospho-N-acetylmuramoyl-pentapeptide-transferase [Candidatus Curtissbacteria bacterium RBG_13_40_7]